MNTNSSLKKTSQKGSTTAVVVVVVLVALVIAGYVLWSINKTASSPEYAVPSPTVQATPSQASINADINAASSVDTSRDMDSIDAEFK